MHRFPIDQSVEQLGPQVAQLYTGTRLFNKRYELCEQLGAGGMGVVWRARDLVEEIDVALKFLPGVLVLQDRDMRRLREEVRAGKEPRHPCLVSTYALEVEGSMAVIVMEFVPGETLRENLDANPRGFFEPDEIESWMLDIAEGLAYLHKETSRLHRDLKPANIIVDARNNRARLMDFGISQRIKVGLTRHTKIQETAAAGEGHNTLVYASPQVLCGEVSERRDDLYSFGAVVYEMLTGSPPFFRGSPEMVREQIKDMNLAAPSIMQRRQELVREGANKTHGQELPAAWQHAIAQILSKDHAQRAGSVDEFIAMTRRKPPLAQGAKPTSDASLKFKAPSSVERSLPGRGIARKTAKTACITLGCMLFVYAFWPRAPSVKEVQVEVIKEVPVKDPKTELMLAEVRRQNDDLLKKLAEPVEDVVHTGKEGRTKFWAITRDPTKATRERPFANKLDMQFVPVPGTKPLLLACMHETRSKDFAAFVADKNRGYSMGGDRSDFWRTYHHDVAYKDECGPVGRGEGEDAEKSDHPVCNVDFYDAAAFCNWLSRRDRATKSIGPNDFYRLPTDLEWSGLVGLSEATGSTPKERDGSVTSPQFTGRSGNYSPNLRGHQDKYRTTAPVMSFAPNFLGIYDLEGNTTEWCADWWDEKKEDRVLRGSSWLSHIESDLALSRRGINSPETRYHENGFRCVLEVAARITDQAGGAATPSPAKPTTGATEPKAIPKLETEDVVQVHIQGKTLLITVTRDPGKATREKPYANMLDMLFIPVPGGSPGLFACIHEALSRDYATFIADKDLGYEMKGTDADDWHTYECNGVEVGRDKNEDVAHSNHPVVCVNYNDAKVFCVWLTKRDQSAGLLKHEDRYRLPTHEEWSLLNEPSAETRNPSNTASQNGAMSNIQLGNFAGIMDSYKDSYATTAPVMSFPPNKKGFYDLEGNVEEWFLGYSGEAQNLGGVIGSSWRTTASDSFSSRNFECRDEVTGFRCVLDIKSSVP